MPPTAEVLADTALSLLPSNAPVPGEPASSMSSALLRALRDSTRDAILISDVGGRIVFANRAASQMFGRQSESILGGGRRNLYENQCDADMVEASDRWAMENLADTKTEETLHLPDGLRSFDSTRTPWLNECGELLGVVCISTEVARQKRTEHGRQTGETQLQQLAAAGIADACKSSGALEALWEEEKRALARRLHDELGSALTALNMHLAIMLQQMPDAPQLSERAGQIKGLLDEVTDTVRSMQAGLRPDTLDVFGIRAALAEKALEFERDTGVPCRVDLPDEELSYPPHIDMLLFRTLQGALNSISRRGDATHVDVVLDDTDDRIMLAIRDNGDGLRDRRSSGGIEDEVRRMRGRAACLGGDVMMTSMPGKRTDTVLTLPK